MDDYKIWLEDRIDEIQDLEDDYEYGKLSAFEMCLEKVDEKTHDVLLGALNDAKKQVDEDKKRAEQYNDWTMFYRCYYAESILKIIFDKLG